MRFLKCLFSNIRIVKSLSFAICATLLLSTNAFAAWTNTGYKIYWDDMSVVYIGTDGTRQAPFLDSALTQEMTLTANPKPFTSAFDYTSCAQGSAVALPASTGAAAYADGYITQAGLDEVASATGDLYWGYMLACDASCPSGRYYNASANTCSLCPSGYACPGVTIDQNNVNSDQGKVAMHVITLDANGGTGGTEMLYFDSNNVYADANGTQVWSGSISVPTRTGYTFGGYYYNDTQVFNSSGADTDMHIYPGHLITNSNITLTAHWTPNTITIVWDNVASGAKFGSVTAVVDANNRAESTVSYGGSITTPSKAVEKIGAIFKGWRFSSTPN